MWRSFTFGSAALAVLLVSGCAARAEDPGAASEEDDVAARATTLTFKLVGREWDDDANEWRSVQLSSLNGELRGAGLPPFAEAITVGRADKPAFEELLARVETANAKLHRAIEFRQTWDPSRYVGLCHTGIVTGVRKTVEALRGAAFAETMGMRAYRYKNTKKTTYADDEFWEFHRSENAHVMETWENFDTASDAFLMLTDGGEQGDGTELFAVSIPKCR
jgi:hypothetical protein